MWAIKINFEDSFMYVVDIYTHEIELFPTKEEALEASKIWKNATVEEYNEKMV